MEGGPYQGSSAAGARCSASSCRVPSRWVAAAVPPRSGRVLHLRDGLVARRWPSPVAPLAAALRIGAQASVRKVVAVSSASRTLHCPAAGCSTEQTWLLHRRLKRPGFAGASLTVQRCALCSRSRVIVRKVGACIPSERLPHQQRRRKQQTQWMQ